MTTSPKSVHTAGPDAQRLQVLRSIDKFDKIGRDGVVTLLQKPADEFGANLLPWQAEMIGRFLDTSNAVDPLSAIRQWFADARRVRSRIDLMAALEDAVADDGVTAWDRLLALPANADNTWDRGGRPENIGWALDDIITTLSTGGQP